MKKLFCFLFLLLLTGCVKVDVITTTRDVTVNQVIDSQLEETINNNIAFYNNATVCVLNYQYEASTSANSLGSGVVYKRVAKNNGNYLYYVVTNKHVVDEGEKFSIYTSDESLISADLLGVSLTYDLAVLTFTNSIELNVVPFANYTDLAKGDFIFAMGTPLSTAYLNTVTSGIISGFRGQYVQHDASINAGNSGGPLFNLSGELVGINTLKLSDNTDDSVSIDGIGFAIACSYVEAAISVIEENNEIVVRPVLGVSVMNVSAIIKARGTFEEYSSAVGVGATQEQYDILHGYCAYIPADVEVGSFISTVNSNSSAYKAGLLVNDIIVEINGTVITSNEDIKGAIYSVGVGNSTIFKINRNGTIHNITVTF